MGIDTSGSAMQSIVIVPAVITVALMIYCWYDLARDPRPRLMARWAWAVLVLVLGPIGPIGYLLTEKLGLMQTPSSAPEELSMKQGGNLYFRGH